MIGSVTVLEFPSVKPKVSDFLVETTPASLETTP